MPIDPGLPGGPGGSDDDDGSEGSNGSDSSDSFDSGVVVDPITGATPSDEFPDGSLDQYTYGPYPYQGFSILVALIEGTGGLPGQPEGFQSQWLFDVTDGGGIRRYSGIGTSLEDCRAQAEAWIDAELEGLDPIEVGEEVEVGQDSIDTFYGAYQNCIGVGLPLYEMDFVQTNKTPDSQFSMNLKDNDFFIIDLPINWKAQFQVKIEATDEEGIYMTREQDYAETFTVALDGGESLELGHDSFHVWKNGNDKIDQFSLDQLGMTHTRIQVTLPKDFVQSCPPIPTQEEEPTETTETDETDTDEEEGGWTQDTLWTILGLIVILLLIGWFTSTVRDADGGV